MRILVQLSHPAHFHLYKNVARNLISDGHTVFFLIKSKDILETLLQESGFPYVNINTKSHRGSRVGVLWDMAVRERKMIRFCKSHQIDLLTGSTPEVAHVGWMLHKLRINTGEDDAAVVPLLHKLAGPCIETFLSPTTCNNGKNENKSIKYLGYHELAYLHPNHFSPDKRVVEKYFSVDSPYFILRFASLTAHHDKGIRGINTEIAQKVIDILEPYGRIYITSERALEPQFEKYRIHINMLDMHHVMAFSSLYIGDSQTMAAEAGVLGVPFIRFNDFVGRIGYLNELENEYELGYGISPSEPVRLFDTISMLVSMPSRKEVFCARRRKMLEDKIDCALFFTWFIENYPTSRNVMTENPDYQFNFKMI